MESQSQNPEFRNNPENFHEQNSEYQDEMQHNMVFHQGPHCLLRQNRSPKKDIQCIGNYNL